MTTPLIPDFIAKLFYDEIYKIQEDTVDKICAKYSLDKKDVMATVGLKGLKWEYTDLRIIHKVHDRNYGTKKGTDKCIARIWDKNEYKLYQCKRSKKVCDFCLSHARMNDENKLVWGTINDPEPKDVEAKKSSKIY